MLVGASCCIASEEFKEFTYKNSFSLAAPKSWTTNESEYLSISDPNDQVTVTASCFYKEDGDIKSFSEYRFSTVQDFYKQQGKETNLKTDDLNIVYRQYEGIWPNETKKTYYVVACIQKGFAFASVSFVTTKKVFTTNSALFESIMKTLKIKS